MINASNDFITAVGQTSRQFKARFVTDENVLDCDIQKVTCYKGSCGDELAIGSVFAPYIEVSLLRCGGNIDGRDVIYQVGLFTGEEYEYIDIGKFLIMDPVNGNSSASFTAVGTLGRTGNMEYVSELVYPATIQSICEELTTIIRGATGAEVTFKGFTNEDIHGVVETPISGKIRDVLSTIGCLLGGFVTEDNAGNVVIAKYNCGDTLEVLPYRSLAIPAVRETPFEVLGVSITVPVTTQEAAPEEEPVEEPEEESEGDPAEPVAIHYEYGTPVIFQDCAWMTQDLFDAMVENFVGLSFDLASIDISLGDPRIEAWDIIELTDLGGNTYHVPCFSIVHTYDGGFQTLIEAEISSSDTSSTRVKGVLEKQVERLDSDVFAATLAAFQAQKDASTASEAAAEAVESAETASGAAAEALAAATAASNAASSAQTSAEHANAQAASATASANSALIQLGEVENVFNVLNWVALHGQYAVTADTSPIEGKWYFELADGEYSVVTPADNANPSALGYYELTGVDEAITNYISTHLALDSSGLWVQMDENAARLQIASDGITLWNESGIPIAQYTDTVTLGEESAAHMTLSSGELGFWHDANTKVAYISAVNNESKLYITEAEITKAMRVGNFIWKVQSASRIALRYSPLS